MDPIISIGVEAPNFQLTDLRGDIFTLGKMVGRIIVINFWSAECIWCERVDHELLGYVDRWNEGVKVVWIASNANEPPTLIERIAMERNIPTVLLDERQHVADLYNAETTPHFFIVDMNGKLVYQGAWDDVSFRQRVATQVYIPEVVEALLHEATPQIKQTPAYGCVLVRFFDQHN
jgi:thiol-disulfide isomerase/thioredoxin